MYTNNDCEYMAPAVPPLYPMEPIYNDPRIHNPYMQHPNMGPYMCPMMNPKIRQCVEMCMRQCSCNEYMEMPSIPVCQEESLEYDPIFSIEEV